MSGAIALAGMATVKGGAGLVTVAVPDSCLETVASFFPCYMTVPLPEDGQGRISRQAEARLSSLCGEATCVALGPGLGRSSDLDQLVRALFQDLSRPLIVDADGLNALAPHIPLAVGGPRILTPHPGEFRRLIGEDVHDREACEARCVALARKLNATIILKGHRSLVTDGPNSVHNETGNPGMATGGSGDVLTGLIASLLAQSLQPFDAARLAAHLHGVAGDLAAECIGCIGMTALDIVEQLPRALLRHTRG